MLAMSFRESNEALWRGARPAHKGTQVIKTAKADNEASTLYIPGAGVIGYIVSVTLTVKNTSGGSCWIYARLQENGTTLYYFLNTGLPNNTPCSIHCSFWPPLEVDSDYTFKLYSNVADAVLYGSLFGWEEE